MQNSAESPRGRIGGVWWGRRRGEEGAQSGKSREEEGGVTVFDFRFLMSFLSLSAIYRQLGPKGSLKSLE